MYQSTRRNTPCNQIAFEYSQGGDKKVGNNRRRRGFNVCRMRNIVWQSWPWQTLAEPAYCSEVLSRNRTAPIINQYTKRLHLKHSLYSLNYRWRFHDLLPSYTIHDNADEPPTFRISSLTVPKLFPSIRTPLLCLTPPGRLRGIVSRCQLGRYLLSFPITYYPWCHPPTHSCSLANWMVDPCQFTVHWRVCIHGWKRLGCGGLVDWERRDILCEGEGGHILFVSAHEERHWGAR